MWLGLMAAPFGLVLGEPGKPGHRKDAPWTLDRGCLDVAIERFLDVG